MKKRLQISTNLTTINECFDYDKRLLRRRRRRWDIPYFQGRGSTSDRAAWDTNPCGLKEDYADEVRGRTMEEAFPHPQ